MGMRWEWSGNEVNECLLSMFSCFLLSLRMAILSFRITFPPNMTAGEEGGKRGK